MGFGDLDRDYGNHKAFQLNLIVINKIKFHKEYGIFIAIF